MTAQISADELAQVVAQTLEEAAFVFTEPGGPSTATAPALLECELAFTGPQTGRLLLIVPEAFDRELAASLLGEEEEEASAQTNPGDAVGEMLNIIGGILVDQWFGSQSACMLGAPRVQKLAADEARAHCAAATCAVTLVTEEAHRVDAAVFLGGADGIQ